MVHLLQIDSIDQLRARSAQWDDLWQRSQSAAPTARAELVAQWIERFAPREAFRALLVEQQGRLLAAWPLVGTRLKGLVELAGTPGNCWSAAGELLLDAQAGDEVVDLLAKGLPTLPWPLVWLDGINPHAAAWRKLLPAIERAGMVHEFREDHQVGLVEIRHDWPAYEASWTKNHRKNMRRTWERLQQAGQVSVAVHSEIEPHQVEPLLRRAFEIEDRSWKGPAGTSVLRSPGIFEYFLAQGRQLAQWRQIEICFLELDGQAIAFEYGYRAHDVHYSHKVSYDERFSQFGPGQLLMMELLKRLQDEPQIRWLDCLGPMSDAVSRWTDHSYPTGRLIISPQRFWSRALLGAYRLARPKAPTSP